MTIKSTLSLLTFALSIIATPPAYSQLSSQWREQQVYSLDQLSSFIGGNTPYATLTQLFDTPNGSFLTYGYTSNKTLFQANSSIPTLLFNTERAANFGLTHPYWNIERFSGNNLAISGTNGFDINTASIYLFDSQSVQPVWSNITPTLAGYEYIDYTLNNRDVSLLLRPNNSSYDPPHRIARWSNNTLNLVTSDPLRNPISGDLLTNIQQFRAVGDGYSFIGKTGMPFSYNDSALYHYRNGSIQRIFSEADALAQGVTFFNPDVWNFSTVLGEDGNLFIPDLGDSTGNVLYTVINGHIQSVARVGQTVSTPIWGDVAITYIGYGIRSGSDVLFMGGVYDPNTDNTYAALFLSQNGTISFVRTLESALENLRIDSFSGNSFTAAVSRGNDQFGLYRYTLGSVVPEPGSVALFASLGVIGLAYTRRRNNIALHKAKNSRTLRHFFLLVFLSGILWVSSINNVLAQTVFNKTVFYDTAQSDELLGFSDNRRPSFFYATQDNSSSTLSFGYRSEYYTYTYHNEIWKNLLPTNLTYDMSTIPSNPQAFAVSDGKALITPRSGTNNTIEYVYISDGVNARSVARDADWNGVDPRSVRITAASFVDSTLYAAINTDPTTYKFDFYQKRGDNVLLRLNSAPLRDPRFGFIIEGVEQISPLEQGIAFSTRTSNGNTLYEYRDGEVIPLLDSGTDFFGDGRTFLLGQIKPSSTIQDGFLFQYGNSSILDTGIGLYRNGSITKILEPGQQLPNGAGTVISISNAWLDDGKIVLQVKFNNGTSSANETALLYYQQGTFQIVDRYFSNYSFFSPSSLGGLVNNSFLVTEPYTNENGGYGGYRVFRYSAVPEPGTVALFASLSVMGLAYTRRRNNIARR